MKITALSTVWQFLTPVISINFSGDITVQVEPSWHYPITCCCHVTDGSRGAFWQSGSWHGCTDEAKVSHWTPPCGKNWIHWHSLTLAECLWSPNSGYEQSEVVAREFQQLRHIPDGHAQLSHQQMKSIWSAHPWESVNYDQGTVYGD